MQDPAGANIKQDIHAETAKIAWADLQHLFAAGKVVYIAGDLDLIDAALQIAQDNTSIVTEWMKQGKLVHVSDEQARTWNNSKASVWAVVVKPWVLVQEI